MANTKDRARSSATRDVVLAAGVVLLMTSGILKGEDSIVHIDAIITVPEAVAPYKDKTYQIVGTLHGEAAGERKKLSRATFNYPREASGSTSGMRYPFAFKVSSEDVRRYEFFTLNVKLIVLGTVGPDGKMAKDADLLGTEFKLDTLEGPTTGRRMVRGELMPLEASSVNLAEQERIEAERRKQEREREAARRRTLEEDEARERQEEEERVLARKELARARACKTRCSTCSNGQVFEAISWSPSQQQCWLWMRVLTSENSPEVAAEGALKKCRMSGAADCQEIHFTHCGAVAMNDNGQWGAWYGPSEDYVRQRARTECQKVR